MKRTCRSLRTAVLPLVVLLSVFVAPPPAMACSCVQPEPMAAYRGDPLKLVFLGTIASAGPGGVEVAVERWFQGGFAPVVRLDGEMFGDQSAACQIRMPEVGTSWVFVAFIPEPGGEPQANLCTPHALRFTIEGQVMLNEILATFGQGAAAGGPSPGPDIEPSPDVLVAGATVAAAALAGLALLGVAAALARRRRAGG
jgi:hypothetical protein